MKKYLNKNVYDATVERIAYCFDEFDIVCVAFSGGKDSGVLLNMVYNYAKEQGLLNKMVVQHIDHEAVYQMTRDYVKRTFDIMTDVRREWFCLPLATQCGCKIDADYWIPWLDSDRDKWVSPMPTDDYIVNEHNYEFADKLAQATPLYEFQLNHPRWMMDKTGGRVVTLTGIRAGESYTRYMRARTDIRKYKQKKFILEQANGTFHGFPIYDWETQDVWIANARFGFEYNHLYDVFYQAGVGIEQMRVSSAFCHSGVHDIKMFKVVEPNTWGKLLSRVNGVSFAGIYGGTTAMGWKSITKPRHLTWKQYCYFLLGTLPDNVREIYEKKLAASKKSWIVGGAVDAQTIQELKEENAQCIFTGKPNNRGKKEKEVVIFNDYVDDTTVSNFARIPSYKRMCVCIMKNDITCKYMGFAPTKEEAERRRLTIEKFNNL